MLKEFKDELKNPTLLLGSFPQKKEKPRSFRLIKEEINQNALTIDQFLH